MSTYEERLDSNLEWALSEGSLFFENRGAVQEALKRIAKSLDELGIPYAVVGGMALYAHGFRRFTEDIDILVTRDSLNRIHQELEGRGYVAPFERSKNLRDTVRGVRIEFLVAGQFPGDGKPKPVAFPAPDNIAVDLDGVRYVNLPTLVELKLASGISNPSRGRDLVDVQDLIVALRLPNSFATNLNPYVQEKYQELWRAANHGQQTFVKLLRRPWLDAVMSQKEVILLLREHETNFDAMVRDGVVIQWPATAKSADVLLSTGDAEVARKYDMHAKDELLLDD